MSFANFLYPRGFYIDESSENYLRIVIPQLEKGYGITIGNALRRILLSSIEGYSVVAVYIDGVVHEFSAIEGVIEDVPYILLNIKKIRFKIDGSIVSLPVKVSINFEGPGEIRAKDIETQVGIEVINKDQYIATVTTQRKVHMDIFIDKGIGFIPKEDYPEEYKDLFSFGTIFVDGNFSPVEKVNWLVEKTRYEAHMDKDKLIIEIWTNGTIEPIEAYNRALEILEKHISILRNEIRKPIEELEYEDVEEFSRRVEEFKSRKITELALTPRVIELLKSKGIKTVSDIISFSEAEVNDWFIEAGLSQMEFEDLKRKISSLSLEFSKKAGG
ncbi:MAG: DNA-directed RNA polymerase subunit alpha [candidate division WOR-3 bacterium]